MEFELNDIFSVPQDVIEEDALNEKFCIQVLRIMITKADTEIDELENYLVFLQSELAWEEYDEWFEICCNALRKKFDCLYIAVRNLKNKDKDDVDVSLFTHRKPAEKVHEILKALLNDYFQEKDKQVVNADVLDSSDPSGQEAELLGESTTFSNSDHYASVKEDIQEPCITMTDNGAILKTLLTVQEKNANHSEAVKLVNGSVKDSSPQSLKLEAVHGDNKKELSGFDIKSAVVEEVKEPGFSLKVEKKFQNLSLKTQDKKRHNQDMVKVQPAGIKLKYFCRHALKHVAGQSKRKKILCMSDPKFLSEQAEENKSAPQVGAIVLDPSLKPMEMSENLSERPINAVVKDSDCRHETGLDKGKTTMWQSDSKVHRNEEVSTSHTTSTAGIKMLESSSNPEGKGNPQKADKPSRIFLRNTSNNALSHSTGLRGKRNNKDSRLATSRQAKGGTSDNFDASKHTSSLSGRRNYSDSSLAISKEKGGNSDVNADTLQHETDLCERRSNSDSARVTARQFKVGKCDSSSLGDTTGLNQRRNHSDSCLGAFRKAKGRYHDMDQKLCDFAQKNVHEGCIKESNFILTEKIDSSYSEAEEKRKPCHQTVEFEKAGLMDNGHSDSNLFLELQDEKDITNSQPDEVKVQSEEVQMAETTANDEKLDLDSSVKPQKQKAKRKIESNLPSVQELGFLSNELASSSSLISKAKRQWKSGLGSDSSSNQCLDREAIKKITDHKYETEEVSVASDDSQILISQPQKKRKKNSSLPILVEIKGSTLETDSSILHSHLNDSAVMDDLSITESYPIDSSTEAVASSCFATSKLKNMKVGDLRTIAKAQKLRKYSKLRKSDLIERIANHLGC